MKKFSGNYLFFVASIIFYITAIVGCFNGGEFDVISFTLGSAMLCIGCGTEAEKKKKEKKNEENTVEAKEEKL